MTNATQTTAQEESNINMYGVADIDAYRSKNPSHTNAQAQTWLWLV
jgi:hypothetical protein